MCNESIRDLLREAIEILKKSNVDDAAADARFLLQDAADMDGAQLRLHYDDTVSPEIRDAFWGMVRRRADGEPLQYILGEWDFFGHTFSVHPGVLIPRPETEFLVKYAIHNLPVGGVLYDVCAGSGCIGISIALARPDSTVFLLEKYDLPVRCCHENILRLGVQNVTVLQQDITQGMPERLPKADCIVSNPPYVPTGELASLQREVQKEPREALDGGEDGLLFYHYLFERWFPILRENGFLCMECGEGQARSIADIFSDDACVFPDYLGTERFVSVIQHRKGL